eukprot:3811803-Pleurochrysis_carterae.AAC.2
MWETSVGASVVVVVAVVVVVGVVAMGDGGGGGESAVMLLAVQDTLLVSTAGAVEAMGATAARAMDEMKMFRHLPLSLRSRS